MALHSDTATTNNNRGIQLRSHSNLFLCQFVVVGQHKIEQLDKVMLQLHEVYGKIVKVSGLIGHPDLLFIYDGDEIRNTFRREEVLPHRPAMPSLHYYKGVLHKDFFGDCPGIIGV